MINLGHLMVAAEDCFEDIHINIAGWFHPWLAPVEERRQVYRAMNTIITMFFEISTANSGPHGMAGNNDFHLGIFQSYLFDMLMQIFDEDIFVRHITAWTFRVAVASQIDYPHIGVLAGETVDEWNVIIPVHGTAWNEYHCHIGRGIPALAVCKPDSIICIQVAHIRVLPIFNIRNVEAERLFISVHTRIYHEQHQHPKGEHHRNSQQNFFHPISSSTNPAAKCITSAPFFFILFHLCRSIFDTFRLHKCDNGDK